MKNLIKSNLLLILTILSLSAIPGYGENLLRENNIKYLGSFRVPQGIEDLYYSTGVLAYNPSKNSLFITGSPVKPSKIDNNHVAEISIPNNFVASSKISDLPISTILQDPIDITNGHLLNILPNANDKYPTTSLGTRIGGLLVDEDRLLGSIYAVYDSTNMASRSHFVTSIYFSDNSRYFKGNFTLGTSQVVPQAGFIAGYMANIPEKWKDLFNADVLTGQAVISIINRTSYGPSAFAFYKKDIYTTNDINKPITNVAALVYYPDKHRTLGAWTKFGPANNYISISDDINGIVFPENFDTILFIGEHGSVNCYGIGTTNPHEHGNVSGESCEGGIIPAGDHCCLDPYNLTAKGTHGYPKKAWLWAYKASDLLAVKNHTKLPYEIRPYATWELPIPITTWNGKEEREINIGGAAYDPKSNRMYVSQTLIDGKYSKLPIINVYQIDKAYGPKIKQVQYVPQNQQFPDRTQTTQ